MTQKESTISRYIDATLAAVAPTWRANRLRARLEGDAYQTLRANSYREAMPNRLAGNVHRSYGESGIRSLTGQHHRHLRNRAMNLDKNNVFAKSLLSAQATFAVGSGSIIESKTGDDKLDQTIEGLWESWWEQGFPEVRGLLTGGSIEHTLWRSCTRDGDIGLLMLDDGSIQIITSDMIDSPNGQKYIEVTDQQGNTQTNVIVDGVEMDDLGRHIAYHIKQFTINGTPEWRRIDAASFIYLTNNNDVNNVRGEPCFSASATMFEQLDSYISGVSTAALVSAMYVMVSHSKSGNAPFSPGQHMGGGSTPASNRPAGPIDVEPGSFIHLPDSDSVTALKPEQPTQSFESFTKTMLLFLSRELQLPPEVALQSFDGSYSASRGALVQAALGQKNRYHDFSIRLLSRLYKWKVQQWIAEKKIVIPAGVTDPFYHLVTQYPHEYLNPVDDVEASQRAVEYGYATWDEEVLKRGKDPEQQRKEIKEINRKNAEAGITFSRSMGTRDKVNPAPV